MKLYEYDDFVITKKKDPRQILAEFREEKADLLHMAVGISKEAGELLDAVARLCFYDKELDVDNVIEEMGDIEFFMSGLRDRIAIILETNTESLQKEILSLNILKLSKRYASGGFSNEEANARADKEETE